jgi:hypothetical protein
LRKIRTLRTRLLAAFGAAPDLLGSETDQIFNPTHMGGAIILPSHGCGVDPSNIDFLSGWLAFMHGMGNAGEAAMFREPDGLVGRRRAEGGQKGK